MNGPSAASLQRVGLQWYAEDDDFSKVPKSCALKPYYDKENDRHAIALLSRECVEAVTGKSSGTLTSDDTLTIQRYAQSVWGGNMTTTAFQNLNDGIALVRGKDIASLPLGLWTGKFRSGIDKTSDAVDTVVDTAAFFANPMNMLAIGALVVGLGLVGIGVFRLLR